MSEDHTTNMHNQIFLTNQRNDDVNVAGSSTNYQSSRGAEQAGNTRQSIPPYDNNNLSNHFEAPHVPLPLQPQQPFNSPHPNFVGVRPSYAPHPNSMTFFEFNSMVTSVPQIQFGMGMSSSYAPSSSYVNNNTPNTNTPNTPQYMGIWPPGHFVTPSPSNYIVPPMQVVGSSSSHPSPLGVQPNQLPPMFRNQQDLMVEYSMALLNALERLDRLEEDAWRYETEDEFEEEEIMANLTHEEQERLDQLEEDAWRYEIEDGLEEEEIMVNITHEVFQSNPEDKEKEKCVICQEDFVNGEHIGRLNCHHMFHLECIKEWLLRKNACPICKQTALYLPDEEYESSDE